MARDKVMVERDLTATRAAHASLRSQYNRLKAVRDSEDELRTLNRDMAKMRRFIADQGEKPDE